MDENRICLPSSFRSAVDKEVITNVVNMSQTPQVVRKQLKRSGFLRLKVTFLLCAVTPQVPSTQVKFRRLEVWLRRRQLFL